MKIIAKHVSLLFVLLVEASGCASNANGPTSTGGPTSHPSSVASSTPNIGLSVTGSKKGYVGLFGDGAVAVLDLATKQVVKTLPVTAPDGLVLTPDGKKVYVSSGDTGTVKVITTADDTVIASVAVGAKPSGLAISPDGRRVVAAVSGDGEAVIIDTTTDAVVKRVKVAQAHASCISANGQFAYVGSQATGAPAVLALDLASDAPPTSFPVDKSPRMLACGPAKVYFTAVGLSAVEVLDPANGTVATRIPTGGSPHDVRATVDGKLELVVSQTAGDLEVIDPVAGAVIGAVPTGKMPHWIALSSDGGRAYVTNEGDNNVVVVDLASLKVTDTLAVGKAPRKMAMQP